MKMLLLSGFHLILLLSMVQLCQCAEDIQYSYKVVSDIKGDGFASCLATSYRHLVIGAPYYNDFKGYVMVDSGTKIHAPNSIFFGQRIDVNQHFIVAMVGGEHTNYVAVFSTNRPYNLLATIPIECGSPECMQDIKIQEDNTIIFANYPNNMHGVVSVYGYNGEGAWSKEQEITVYECYPSWFISLTASGSNMAVGYGRDYQKGRINIYTRVNKKYVLTTTLQSPEPVTNFGHSVSMEGLHMIVGSNNTDNNSVSFFIYQYDPSTSIWKNNGRLVVTASGGYGRDYYPRVSLHGGILAITVNDPIHHPEVCAHVYKLLSTTTNNNSSDDVTSSTNSMDFRWKKVANLRTNNIPVKQKQYHRSISVQDGMVFTGRAHTYDGDGYGMVFVHNV